MRIYTSKYSHKSAKLLGDALNCTVYNPYQNIYYRGPEHLQAYPVIYNMGCSSHLPSSIAINRPDYVAACVDKLRTFLMLENAGVMVVPYTRSIHRAKEWLEEDRIIVNRRTLTGKANDGVSFSCKGLDHLEDCPIDEQAVAWTRYVNHTRELRAYVFKGQSPLVFHKVEVDGNWVFEKIKPSRKLLGEITKAQEAFNGLVFSAFDILECVTGDYYFLENNSAPTLEAHEDILPKLVKTINKTLEIFPS